MQFRVIIRIIIPGSQYVCIHQYRDYYTRFTGKSQYVCIHQYRDYRFITDLQSQYTLVLASADGAKLIKIGLW